MPIEILPAVLGRTPDQFRKRLRIAQTLGRQLHIDLMDGQIVATKSPKANTLAGIRIAKPVEVHCMVERPVDWLKPIFAWSTRRVILPVELGQKLRPLIALFRSRRIAVSLALSPKSRPTLIQPWTRFLDSVVVMGVEPGSYGSFFQAATFRRIRTLRKRHPRLSIACDGGVTAANISALRQAGAQRFAVGSFLLRSQNPVAALRELRTAVRG